MTEASPRVRAAEPRDLDAIVALCAEHAEFERAAVSVEAMRRSLGPFLFGDPPRAWCLVVDTGPAIVGYATCSLEFSTWRAAEYVHLDCLFLTAPYRNRGLGRRLLREIRSEAWRRGCAAVEWQTPASNESAIRFYRRLGAEDLPKARFRWVAAPESPGGRE